jgi:hypothetical protein
MKDKIILAGNILLIIVLFNAIKTGSFSVVAGILCVLSISVKRRFYPSSKKVYWVVGMILLVIIGSLIDYGFSRPATNTDQKYSKIDNLTYQNTAYNFSITFPEGWIISPAESGASKYVVQKATRGSTTISIAIRDVPLVVGMLSSDDKTIKDLVSFEELKEIKNEMEDALPGVGNFEFKETLVGQIPAYLVKYTAPSMKNGITTEHTVEQYQFFYNNVLYMISIEASSSEFDSMKDGFDVAISSFTITK